MVLRLIFIAFLLLLGCGEPSFDNPTDPRNISPPKNIEYTSFTDVRDGKSYKSVVIGTQTWMAENLNYQTSSSLCMDNVEHRGFIKDTLVSKGGYCGIYGRFYNWATAKSVCPDGWHLPGNVEWGKLLSASSSWTNLKSKQGWAKGQQGTDSYGFAALPSGSENDEIASGTNSCWWSITEENVGRAHLACTSDDYFLIDKTSSFYPIRCVKDELCGSKVLDLETQFCDNGKAYDLCGGLMYNPASQQCSADNKVESKLSSSSRSRSSSSAACKPEDNNYNYYCSNGTIKEYGFVADDDGQEYKTVVIGSQTWMAENYNYDVDGSICYDYDDYNCSVYGRLYDWMTAMALPSNCSSRSCADLVMERKDICPIGWHIPDIDDWNILINTVGGPSLAGIRLKATYGWDSEGTYNGNGKDTYSFEALPGAALIEDVDVDYVPYIGGYGGWWASTERYKGTAYYLYMRYDYEDFSNDDMTKTSYYSVRCVKDD